MGSSINVTHEFFSDAYLKFYRLYSQTEVHEPAEPPVPEKVIRCVWNDQLFKTPNLKTTDGQTLEVVFPGYWNFGSGPDFKSAAVRIDGELLEGDVELHVYGSDWTAHRHSDNNEYDNVILHVFMWKGRGNKKLTSKKKPAKPEPKLSRPHIHELELKKYLKRGILKLNEELDFDTYPVLHSFNYGLCHQPLSRLPEEKLLELLNAAGDARIHTKMDRFHDRVITKGYEQTFYEGVAEAMGYPSNKMPFRILAENVPVAEIHEMVPARASGEKAAEIIQAVLFGVSGLIDFDELEERGLAAADRTFFNRLKKHWEPRRDRFEDRLMSPRDWKFGKMRPANFPYRRIAALSHLLVRHWEHGLFVDYLETLKSVVPKSAGTGYTKAIRDKLTLFFCVEAVDYWSRHYTPGGKPLKQKQQLVGPDRSREVAINIALPIGLIYARASKSVPLEQALRSLFQTKNRPADNKWIRFMKHYILGNEEHMLKPLTSDQQTQGLMQIYQDYCTKNENNCLRCKFPGMVERYFS
ncbi:DUF2851 family protein [Nitrospina watsonii]|uniref:DUF2851 family protein n=1 Tax=Nitrospina watsonii TaxID=1323948 RepID=A0ABN8VZ88_9BACT|nr:DUF2851 family protein [Nitrospina watsonii]CAI2717234.1 conserved protein of unknown function [Nitrospina watsonii]